MDLIGEILGRVILWLFPGAVVWSLLGLALAFGITWAFPGDHPDRVFVALAVVGFVWGVFYDFRTGGIGSGPGPDEQVRGMGGGPSSFGVVVYLLVAGTLMIAEVALVLHVMR